MRLCVQVSIEPGENECRQLTDRYLVGVQLKVDKWTDLVVVQLLYAIIRKQEKRKRMSNDILTWVPMGNRVLSDEGEEKGCAHLLTIVCQ